MSLPEVDVEYLDRGVSLGYFDSRSAGLHAALSRLREDELAEEYQDAFKEWHASEDAQLWDGAIADGLEISDSRATR